MLQDSAGGPAPAVRALPLPRPPATPSRGWLWRTPPSRCLTHPRVDSRCGLIEGTNEQVVASLLVLLYPWPPDASTTKKGHRASVKASLSSWPVLGVCRGNPERRGSQVLECGRGRGGTEQRWPAGAGLPKSALSKLLATGGRLPRGHHQGRHGAQPVLPGCTRAPAAPRWRHTLGGPAGWEVRGVGREESLVLSSP